MSNYFYEGETDTESYDSWNETDDETDYGDIMYEPEESSLTKFNIVVCEKYNQQRHGITTFEVNRHYLTHFRFKLLDVNLINNFTIFGNAKLEIAECIYLPSDHCVSIIKTFWLKLIQKRWKNILKERKMCISRRSNPNAIHHREIYGKWPNNCINYPLLKGMLFNLSRASSRSYS